MADDLAHNATNDLTEILAAALGAFDEGIAVLDSEARVLLWNHAAVEISGYQSADMLAKPLPTEAYEIDAHHLETHKSLESNHGQGGVVPVLEAVKTDHDKADAAGRPVLVHIRHRQGHSLPAMLHRTPLRDVLGKRFGTLLRFHPIEEIDTLPHGETDGCDDGLLNHLEESQSGLEDRLDEALREWHTNDVPFGVLWIRLDQAATLRKTHGRDASEAMLRIVEQTMLHGLRPTEMLGRWGTNEYLVLSHERTPEMLERHAQHLAAVTRTADFRWWGDRVPLTVSIGAAQAEQAQTLSSVLKRAQQSMETSQRCGGDRVTRSVHKDSSGAEEQRCSQS